MMARLDELSGYVNNPLFRYRGPWWLLRIPGRHIIPRFARRSWWTWIPEGAEVYAMAEVRS